MQGVWVQGPGLSSHCTFNWHGERSVSIIERLGKEADTSSKKRAMAWCVCVCVLPCVFETALQT